MTDHSIAELKRQYDQARSAAISASHAERKAFSRLNAAKCADMEAKLAARGIVPGVKVVRSYGSTREHGIFTGVETHYASPEPRVSKLKKDGTAHASHFLRGCTVDNITLHTGGGK